jgi:hypothetical protein
MQRTPIFFLPVIAAIVFFPPDAGAKNKNVKLAQATNPVPAPGALDGKSFLGAATEYGGGKGREEIFWFKDGKFTSSLGSVHGFGWIPYNCTKRGDGSFRFIANAINPRAGILHWDVVVYGARLDGVVTWSESQEKIHTYGIHALWAAPAGAAKK